MERGHQALGLCAVRYRRPRLLNWNAGDGKFSLLKNYGPRKNWLLVQCAGAKRNCMGVYVYSVGHRLSGEVQTVASYLSRNDSRLHFGLDLAAGYDRESFAGSPANSIVKSTQGGRS